MASTNLSDNFHLEEKLWAKENDFHWPENPFPLVGMKDFVEEDASTRRKINYQWQEFLKNGEKNFH